ncbi:hypothetical protein SQ11_02195 [Nitrosospira sp. NpAV]|nr:hypothetical protein SQ11_02195 [Nitrosospira sp. NpAV]
MDQRIATVGYSTMPKSNRTPSAFENDNKPLHKVFSCNTQYQEIPDTFTFLMALHLCFVYVGKNFTVFYGIARIPMWQGI